MRRVILLWLMMLLLPAGVSARSDNFSRVGREVDADLAEARREKVRVESEIASARAEWTEKIRDLKIRLAAERSALAGEEKGLAEMRDRREASAQALEGHAADMKALSGVVIEFVRNFLGLAERSPYTAERPERLTKLKALLQKEQHLGVSDIRLLVDLAFEDMAASGRMLRRTGEILDREGRPVQAEILRLGHLSALFDHDGAAGYLHPRPVSGRLMAAAPPGFGTERALKRFLEGKTDTVPMDISGGSVLGQLSHRTTLWEDIQGGGFLVWPILLVGIAAVVLVVERLYFLGRVRQNTDVLMGDVTDLVAAGDVEGALAAADTQAGRPTANVIKAGLGVENEPREVIESSLGEAILRETPRLERFLPALKVLAAVAPLLGLLGTVTGMINTFKVITIHGTGDPRLMAGGISEALITTELGLAVAIPIMLAAAFLGRKAQNIAADMEEKAMAMTAALLKRQRNGR